MPRPNILFIMADDMGYGDVGCYNPQSKIPTPNMDRLAREGVRFSDAHSPAAVCTPKHVLSALNSFERLRLFGASGAGCCSYQRGDDLLDAWGGADVREDLADVERAGDVLADDEA